MYHRRAALFWKSWPVLLVVFLFARSVGGAASIPGGQAPWREIYDRLAAQLRSTRGDKPSDNTAGGIAWGDSYELDAHLEMFQATGDTGYLVQFVALADRVVAARADHRGEPDFEGKLRAGWLTGGHYTWGVPTVLVDSAGVPSLEVTTSLNAYNNQSAIEVLSGAEGHFSIVVRDRRDGKLRGEWRDVAIATAEACINPPPGRVGPLRVRRLGANPPVARAPFTPPTAKTVLHGHHTGKIIAPLARFAALIRQRPALSSFSDKAAEYLRCAEDTVPEQERSWVDLGASGYYIFERNIPFWSDGLPEPHNTLAATGTAFLWLYEATGRPLYRQRVEQLARFIRDNLEPRADGTWMFYYWFGPFHTGWKASDNLSTRTPQRAGAKSPEDISHLQLTVRFMAECAERGLVFTREDLTRFARTFNERLFVPTPDGGTLRSTMAADDRRLGAYDSALYGFALLGVVDRQVFERCRDIYLRRFDQGANPPRLYGWGVLNRMARVLDAAGAPAGGASGRPAVQP